MGIVDKKTIEILSDLARIGLKKTEEEALVGDLEKILEHFGELKDIDTDKVEPMFGGTQLQNSFRVDGVGSRINAKKSTEQFPESKDGFLKIPPVFE
ncbi:MAG: Asp-tRNA(Asn)/Glu-tRNA(Gln) amidotransferase subunit GatC [Patescibacteria group bacterium]